MTIQFVRFIDFWIGIPLCFLFTQVRRLASIVSKERRSGPKKVLFIELSEMGSAILAYTALKRVHETHSGVELYFLIFKKNAESVRVLGIVPEEHIVEIDESSFSSFCVSALSALVFFWKRGIDTVIDLELFSRFTMLFSYLTGASVRVGFYRYCDEGLYRGELLTHRVHFNTHQHVAKNFLALSLALESSTEEVPMVKQNLNGFKICEPRYEVSDEERRIAAELLPAQGLLIAVNPDSGNLLPHRAWPLEYFGRACRMLLEQHPSAKLVLTGLPEARRSADRLIVDLPPERVVDLTGQTASVGELIAVLQRVQLILTSDCGVGHFASLTQTPAVVLFGPESPERYGALSDHIKNLSARISCSPCYTIANHRKSPCNNNICMKMLEPEYVVAQSLELLEQQSYRD